MAQTCNFCAQNIRDGAPFIRNADATVIHPECATTFVKPTKQPRLLTDAQRNAASDAALIAQFIQDRNIANKQNTAYATKRPGLVIDLPDPPVLSDGIVYGG